MIIFVLRTLDSKVYLKEFIYLKILIKIDLDEYNLKKISCSEYNDLRLKHSIPDFKYDY